MELFVGKPLLGPDGSECDAKKALEGKMIALYFSAMWCPSCRQFTPKLGRFYKELKEAGKNFEIVLVSRDREDEDLKEYLTEHCGGWVGIPFGDERIQQFLAKYEVPTIPALKVLKADGSILVADARNQVQEKGRDDPVKLFEEWEALLSK
ncbi:antioxidant, AhpC/TSA family [Ancylostoma caninum]|uniref:protein-disulfide reductase n=2 Tax=Ancylostoma caninum TaxID=29170 RepID=A0A368FII5_ANCCA|nr:antioxidant, AhpC/TSA family [Ancylostoma caninum]